MTPTTEAPKRRETDEERAEREQREAAERLAARQAELDAMPLEQLLSPEVRDDELGAARSRIPVHARPTVPAELKLLAPRSAGHDRIDALKASAAQRASGAVVAAARSAAAADGPSTTLIVAALNAHQLAQAPPDFWASLRAVVDAPAPAGMAEKFADFDPVAEATRAWRENEARVQAIDDELEAREIARRTVSRPGMAARIAKLAKGGGK